MRDTEDNKKFVRREDSQQGKGPLHSAKDMLSRIGPLAGDWIVVVCMGIAGLAYNKMVAPHEKMIVSGQDEELSYPVMPQTVPEAYLAVAAYALPLIIICGMCEYLKDRRDMHINSLMLTQSIAMSVLFTTLAKKQAGRPRPNFFAMCGWSNNVTDTGAAGCTAPEQWQWESRQSFPSGHSSFAFAGYLYFTLFLLDKAASLSSLRRLPQSIPISALQLLACVPCMAATWVAITRVMDYWHNYDDILAGSVLGSACASLAFWQRGRYSSAWFEERRTLDSTPLAQQGDDSNEV